MNPNIRLLAKISKQFDLSVFYTISIWQEEINLQAKHTKALNRLLLSNKFSKTKKNSNGHFTYRRGIFQVTLTTKR